MEHAKKLMAHKRVQVTSGALCPPLPFLSLSEIDTFAEMVATANGWLPCLSSWRIRELYIRV